MSDKPKEADVKPEHITRCVRIGCGGVVLRSWSAQTGTVYQCDRCKGCGKGSPLEIRSPK